MTSEPEVIVQPTADELAASTADRASAVLAASIFHFGEASVGQAKAHMARAGLSMRLDPV